MLKKHERLTRTEFETYFKQGKRFHGDHITMIYLPYPTFHAAVVVSKKVSKKAVVRNTLRRRVYAMLYIKKQKGVTGIWIALIKPGLLSLTKQQAKTQTENLVERVVKTA
jgi:ribonuclease P protein component